MKNTPVFATFREVFQNRSGNRFTACIQQKLLGDFKKKGHMSSSQNNTKKRATGRMWVKSKDKEVAPTIQLEDYFAHLMSFYEDDMLPFILRSFTSLLSYSYSPLGKVYGILLFLCNVT